MRDWTGDCQRCYRETGGYTMSMYSELLICMDCCDKENKRDDYKEARDADVAAIKAGNYNFKGIGEPGR